ncbi:MAG: PIN domain-containing protein [Halobacteriales archaeon]|nr:PIN domain-containing protein [Halobacteriales archaeon]
MIVVDTSFIVARKNKRDAHHARAVAAWPEVMSLAPLLVHEYVFLETINVVVRRLGLAQAIDAGRELLESAEVEVVPASPRFPESWESFAGQRGSDLSLADAALVSLAKERAAPHIATFDQGFRKAKGVKLVPGPA